MMARTLIYNNVKRVYILGSVSFELSSAIRSLPSPLDARVVPIICDITSKDELNSAVRKIKTQEGYINFLIVNAGISGPSEPGQELADDIKGKGKAIASSSRAPTTFDELEMDDFTKTPEFNTTGARRTVLAFLPLLEEGNKFRPRGSPTSHILFTASASAVTRTFADKSPAYAASRAANLHLMKILSAYSAERGWHSRMNAFLPGMGATPMTAGLPFLQGQNGKKSFEGGGVPKEVSPAERILGEEDVAGAVLYLCSKAGEMLDGCVLLADGGRVGVVPVTS